MPTDSEIRDAGSLIKRAASELDDAGRRKDWDDARKDIDRAATYLRQAGEKLEA